jgi:hypothetical protein
MIAQKNQASWKITSFALAVWAFVACLSCSAAKKEAPEGPRGHGVPAPGLTANPEPPEQSPVEDPKLPEPNPVVKPKPLEPDRVVESRCPKPVPWPLDDSWWCPCRPQPGQAPVPPSSGVDPRCPCLRTDSPHWQPRPPLHSPPRPLSKNVPDRECKKDRECGDGICDQGRCSALWAEDRGYGQRCNASPAGPFCDSRYFCREGRCRSCVSDEECREANRGTQCVFSAIEVSCHRACIDVEGSGPSGR